MPKKKTPKSKTKTKTPSKPLATYLQSDLLARGWSKTTIANVLGAPDEVCHRYGGGEYYLYLASRVHRAERGKRWRKRDTTVEPQRIDLLDALVAVSRAAKRHRDAASAHYEAGSHGLAGKASARKRELYELKDQAVAHLVKSGQLRHVEYHRFGERWAALVSPPDRPEIRIHVPCEDPQQPGLVVADLGDSILARRQGAVRIADAEHTLRAWLKGKRKLSVYHWPAVERPERVAVCYECGGDWVDGGCMDCGRVAYGG